MFLQKVNLPGPNYSTIVYSIQYDNTKIHRSFIMYGHFYCNLSLYAKLKHESKIYVFE